MKNIPVLTTERLTLRQLLESDVEEIFTLRSDILINKFLNRQPSTTIENALEFIKTIKINRLLYWAIVQRGDEKLVGTICLFDISEDLRTCEIGYELLTEFQGKGIMREAALEVIEYSIKILGLKTIDAYTHKDNQNSTNLLKELKFERTHCYDVKDSNLILFRLNASGNNQGNLQDRNEKMSYGFDLINTRHHNLFCGPALYEINFEISKDSELYTKYKVMVPGLINGLPEIIWKYEALTRLGCIVTKLTIFPAKPLLVRIDGQQFHYCKK